MDDAEVYGILVLLLAAQKDAEQAQAATMQKPAACECRRMWIPPGAVTAVKTAR